MYDYYASGTYAEFAAVRVWRGVVAARDPWAGRGKNFPPERKGVMNRTAAVNSPSGKKQLLFWSSQVKLLIPLMRPILKNKKAIKKAISEVDVLNFVPSQTPR